MKRRGKPVFAAFNQGEKPTIICINKSTIPFEQWNAGQNFDVFVAAMQKYLDKYFTPVWSLGATLHVGKTIRNKCWGMVFTDTADMAGALGYHDTTKDGFPLMHNFVKTTMDDGELVSVTATHELVEALGDPCINLLAQGPQYVYAYELADAVERDSFPVDGIQMSDFVYPAWFENFKRPKYDYMGKCKHPFEIRPGGYMPVFDPQTGWTQIFGSEEAKKRFNPDRHPRFDLRQRR